MRERRLPFVVVLAVGLFVADRAGAEYAVPQAVPAAERATVYPDGDRAAAKKHNRAGLKAREGGDGAGALAAYRAAVAASPAYAPGRYNLSCELALAGQGDAAIEQLEHLLRLGTPEARSFVARARFDPDFARVAGDPRFRAIGDSFRLDEGTGAGTGPGVLAQVCADPGRLVALIHPERGIGHYLETESAADDVKPEKAQGPLAPRDALRFVRRLLGPEGLWCDGGRLRTYSEDCERKLADFDVSTTPVCLTRSGCMEWTEQEEICLARDDGKLRIAFAARTPDGPIDPGIARRTAKAVTAEREKALARFAPAAAPTPSPAPAPAPTPTPAPVE